MGQHPIHGHIVKKKRWSSLCGSPLRPEELHLEARERIEHHVSCVFEEIKGFKVDPVQYDQLRPS